MKVARHSPLARLLAGSSVSLGALAAVLVCFRTGSNQLLSYPGHAFVKAGSSSLQGRRVPRSASRISRQCREYEAVVRRDGTEAGTMAKWQSLQMKSRCRALNVPESRIEEAANSPKVKAWHLNHIKPGDKFQGWFQHPEVSGDKQVRISVVIGEDGKGHWDGPSVKLSEDFGYQQDFAITHERGQQRNLDMAAYCFQKVNDAWLNWENETYPAPHQMERLNLACAQRMFKRVSEIDNFPDEETYKQQAKEPELGMTRQEFVDWLEGEEEGYVGQVWSELNTGRRIRMSDGDLVLDGDFSIFPGLINGFAELGGRFVTKQEGRFQLELEKPLKKKGA